MEERRWDNQVVLTDNATLRDFIRAANKPENKSVALHKPGSVITDSRGRRYRVADDGSWRREGKDNG